VQSPAQVLGEEMAAQLRTIKPDGWYPIALLLDLMERLDAKLGPYAMRQMGRTLFKMSHEARVKEVARSARDILFGLDGMYHHANHGRDIGGWKVVLFEPGRAEMDKNTPHHCVMEEGILLEALGAVGVSANIRQGRCFRRGADSCQYLVTSYITDARWTGETAPGSPPARSS
jgi:hypothetical protein